MLFRTNTCRDYSKYNHTILALDIKNYYWNPVYTETNVSIAQSLTGRVIKNLKIYATMKLNKLSRNIKKICYLKTEINLLSFGIASKKCFL